VVLDETGTSKGFGFIRFGNEIEQQTALTSMQGISGLGGKPIKVKKFTLFS
jgi:RNA recognition motif-containing protein